jgi:large subunit ribosomal protein L5
MSRLKIRYNEEVRENLQKEFSYTNPMAIPRITKVVVNAGVGEAIANVKLLDAVAEEIGQITGQRAVIRKARKSIAGFKLREGMPIGVKVTLRGGRMWDFLDRLLNVALPRVRDFRGVSPKAFDGRGNYTIGLKDQLIFPEIEVGRSERVTGMNVTIVTTARTDGEGRALLAALGMPFAKREERRMYAI